MNQGIIRHIAILCLFAFQFLPGRCGEGMWLPLHIDSLNLQDMQRLGLTLGAGEIYSREHPSIKDAVVIFGNGCTGEVISPDGLLITNHHCGFSRVQQHSTVEKNYLADGFWAASGIRNCRIPDLRLLFL